MAFPFDVLSWLIRGRYKTSPTAVSDGGTPELLTDALGRLRVVIDSALSSSYSFHATTNLASQGAIKASAGSLRQLVATNTGGTAVWLAVCNSAALPGSPEALAASIKLLLRVPATDTITLPLDGEVAFSTGIYWVAFTDADLETEAGAVLKIHALYL